MSTHSTPGVEKPRDRRIEGKAMLTIVVSTTAMNEAVQKQDQSQSLAPREHTRSIWDLSLL